MKQHSYLDNGFVTLVDIMGDDAAIEAAARMSYGQGTRPTSDTRALIRYLMRHQHSSPFEMGVVRFHLKIPIFVMRQLVRHRTASINEQSLRYSESSHDYYLPEVSRMNKQSTDNKQGSADEIVAHAKEARFEIAKLHSTTCTVYDELLDGGLTRELARNVLPVSLYTELVWQCNLRNFFHFLKLRLHPHAQMEIRELAATMLKLVEEAGNFSLSIEAWKDYDLLSETFSNEEMRIIRRALDGNTLQAAISKSNLSDREKRELREKLS